MCGGHSRDYFGHHMSTMSMPFSIPVEERKTSPIDVLNERLARGEITVEEYQRMRAVLDDQYRTKHSPHIRKPTTA